MPSPFPGMDPYLEGYLWPDVHHRLATPISDQLMPMLRPRYVARIEIRVIQDATSEADIGIMYPDVTSIAILSPVNKREPGLSTYREKRRQLHAAEVHILEIDLLRRGQRPLAYPRIPPNAYRITLICAAPRCADVWSLHLQDALSIVPIPLRTPDADIPLDLATAFTTIYDRAAYDLSLNDAELPPPPPLSAEEQVWVRQFLSPSA